jgi:hypothetical protein
LQSARADDRGRRESRRMVLGDLYRLPLLLTTSEFRLSGPLPSKVLRALGRLGQDGGLAEHCPHEAMLWRAEPDTVGYEDVAPISRLVRAALAAYLARRPAGGVTSAW